MKNPLVVSLLLAILLGSTPLSADLIIKARAASIKTTGRAIGPESGQVEEGWGLFENGEIGEHVKIAKAGQYQIIVRAGGTPCRNVWPDMMVTVDARPGQVVTVRQKEFLDYSFPVRLAPGLHRITAAFVNDAYDPPTEDRNLYVASIIIRPVAGAPEAVIVSGEQMATEFLKAEEQLVAGTAAAIERNRKADATIRVVDAAGKPVTGVEVTVELARHDFLFGCNIYMFDRFGGELENELYKQRFAELFNYATVGFYWQAYEPERGKPEYSYTDKVVAWCQQHGIAMKGHPLLWADQYGIPRWSKGQPDPETQKQRVTDVLHRYRGKITKWEVVNEPSHLPQLRINEPYRWARAADLHAYLIVNDYYVMANGYPPFFKLLTDALADDVPFDGIGIQAHEPRTERFPLDRVQQILDHYATLGKELHITEFTPTSAGAPITGSPIRGKWDETAQADYAANFYRVCFAHPAVAAITWWDLCDRGSWLDGGGMLRKDLSPKPVYMALHKLIHNEWHTKIAGKTDRLGQLKLRGFLGQYTARATVDGQPVERSFHLGRSTPGHEPVILLKL